MMMSASYSIIFASLRKVTQEKVSLGLVLFDNDIVFCKFSHSKLNALKYLLKKEEFKVINDSITGIEKKMMQSSENLFFDSQQLFKVSDPSFSIDYINYLSRYKNNLIVYSEPKPIDIAATEESAIKLFTNLIGEEKLPETGNKKYTPIDDFKFRFSTQIRNHFISGHTITPDEVPNLLVPVKVDLVGKNGLDVFVQSIDMTSQQNHIINEISTFYLLKETYKKNKLDCQDFVLTQEPPKKLKRQHTLWKQLKDSGEFNYVDISEGERIIEYAEKNDVRPIFGDIDNTKETGDLPF